MNARRRRSLLLLLATLAWGQPHGEASDEMTPTTTAPIVYRWDYSGEFFTDPGYRERLRADPPDLLHVGKAVPISHHWGPTRMYAGENQWTGGPNQTLDWQNIALITPDELAGRIENIRQTVRRLHDLGIPEVVPYISYHTLAGDHEKRLGFWNFYDHWNDYVQWAGPRPPRDPFDWLVVDRQGKFVGGSCGGYSPAYYAPLHRYRGCIRHPDWIEWQRRLARMVAEVGYDGCFVDNTTRPDECYCRYCKAAFAEFLDRSRDVDWVRRLTDGLRPERLALDSPDVPAELVRRFRLLHLRDHLAMLRAVGRRTNPKFTIFPNGNSIYECMVTGALADRLMFESAYAPGLMAAGEPAKGDPCRTHMAAQLFAWHMPARQIFLSYEALEAGSENVQELALAEMAAFSGGGGFSATGRPQAKYRAFFKKYPELFVGWRMTAPAAILYSHWGHNPLGYLRVVAQGTIQEYLAGSHRPYVALLDARLPETAGALAGYREVFLESSDYEVNPRQLAALREHLANGGRIVLANEKILLDGRPVRELLAGDGVVLWDRRKPAAIAEPIAASAGRQRNLRFGLYRRGDELALHVVNYNVCLLDPGKRILEVGPTEVRLPLPAEWTGATTIYFSPDGEAGAEPQPLTCRVADGKLVLTLPKVRVYGVVVAKRAATGKFRIPSTKSQTS